MLRLVWNRFSFFCPLPSLNCACGSRQSFFRVPVLARVACLWSCLWFLLFWALLCILFPSFSTRLGKPFFPPLFITLCFPIVQPFFPVFPFCDQIFFSEYSFFSCLYSIYPRYFLPFQRPVLPQPSSYPVLQQLCVCPRWTIPNNLSFPLKFRFCFFVEVVIIGEFVFRTCLFVVLFFLLFSKVSIWDTFFFQIGWSYLCLRCFLPFPFFWLKF